MKKVIFISLAMALLLVGCKSNTSSSSTGFTTPTTSAGTGTTFGGMASSTNRTGTLSTSMTR